MTATGWDNAVQELVKVACFNFWRRILIGQIMRCLVSVWVVSCVWLDVMTWSIIKMPALWWVTKTFLLYIPGIKQGLTSSLSDPSISTSTSSSDSFCDLSLSTTDDTNVFWRTFSSSKPLSSFTTSSTSARTSLSLDCSSVLPCIAWDSARALFCGISVKYRILWNL